MKKIIFTLAISIFVSQLAFSQIEFENYKIANIGTISIPNIMELQSDNYRNGAAKYMANAYYQLDFSDKVVFHQKGLNNKEKSSFATYARIILNTDLGNPGDYEKASNKSQYTATELRNFETELKGQIISGFPSLDLTLIEWFKPQSIIINGYRAIKVSYLRQYKSEPYVLVNIYKIQNYDREHFLTISYRQQNSDVWAALVPKIVNSFKISIK